MKIEIKKLNEVDQNLEEAFATTLFDENGKAVKTLITKRANDTVESTWNLLYMILLNNGQDCLLKAIDNLFKELKIDITERI